MYLTYDVITVSLGVIAAVQLVVTGHFMYRSRKFNEINYLPKIMMLMASASTVFTFVWYLI